MSASKSVVSPQRPRCCPHEHAASQQRPAACLRPPTPRSTHTSQARPAINAASMSALSPTCCATALPEWNCRNTTKATVIAAATAAAIMSGRAEAPRSAQPPTRGAVGAHRPNPDAAASRAAISGPLNSVVLAGMTGMRARSSLVAEKPHPDRAARESRLTQPQAQPADRRRSPDPRYQPAATAEACSDCTAVLTRSA